MKALSIDQLRKLIGIPLAIGIVVVMLLMPPMQGLSVDGQKALALFAAVFVLYTTEALPLAVTSLGIVPAIVVLGLGKVGAALGGFAAASVYLMMGAFILASAMVKTGLGQRVAYIILKRIGCTSRNVTFGIMVANIVLAFIVPSTTARTLVLLPVCLSMIGLFSDKPRSKFATNLLLTLSFTNATISAGILTSSPPNLIAVDFMAKAGITVSYSDWFVYGFPPALLMTILTWAIIQIVYKPEHSAIEGGDEYIRTNLDKMGKMTAAEWRVLSVFAVVVVLWAIGNKLGIDTTTSCLIGVILLMMPKFGVVTWEQASKEISWGVLLVCGGGLSLGDVLIKTGAAKWLSTQIFGSMGLAAATAIVVILIILLITQYMHLLFAATTSMAAALFPIIMSFAQSSHLDVKLVMLAVGMIIGGYPLLMFYNTLPSIVVYGTGKLNVSDFPKVGGIICLVACIAYALCFFTYWTLI